MQTFLQTKKRSGAAKSMRHRSLAIICIGEMAKNNGQRAKKSCWFPLNEYDEFKDFENSTHSVFIYIVDFPSNF